LLISAGLSDHADEVPGSSCDAAVHLHLPSGCKPSVTWLQEQTWLLSVLLNKYPVCRREIQTGSFFKTIQAVHAADNPTLP